MAGRRYARRGPAAPEQAAAPDLAVAAELPCYRPEAESESVAGKARMQVGRRRRLAIGGVLLGACLLSAIAGLPLVAGAGADSVKVNTAHLDTLLEPVPGGRSVWAAAWYPPGDGRGARRKRGDGAQADPETGLLARTEDIARIASVYLEPGGGPDAARARRARQALEWLLVLQAPDGRFWYGLDAAGKPAGPIGFEWPAVRAYWALAQGYRSLPAGDPLRGRILSAAEKAESAAVAASGPSRLIDGSAAETAAFVLGLLELDQADEKRRRRIIDLVEAIAARRGGDAGTFPYQAHMPTANPSLWHSYGAYQVAALATAGDALGNRAWVAAAEAEAASWTVHWLVSGGPIWGFAPAPRPYPQIPYNLEPQVRGLLALYRATGKDSYGRLAALGAAWLMGDNAAGKPVYQAATGRVHDGLDAMGLAPGAGAEATALGLSVLQQVNRHPEFLRYLDARESGARRAVAVRSSAATRTVAGSGPYAGSSFVLMTAGKRVDFRSDLEGPLFVAPMFLRGLADPSAAGALEVRYGGWSQRFAVDRPADPVVGPVLEVGHVSEPVELRVGDRLTVAMTAGSTLPLALDGVLCQPVVEYRSWDLPRGGKVAVVKSLSSQWLPLQYAWPGAGVMAYAPGGKQVRAGEDLEPYGYALIESGR